jgi:hypothetical protein
MVIPERSLDPNPADGAGLVAHAQALLRFIVGLGPGGDSYIPIRTHKRRPAKNDAV